ncbi:carbohydrate ABC transporter permease [Paenibacillus thalictri]|uniref:Carbohydrate ABC transporter permease n=1 Tax=Paenibacillus thalictri TaxID=2527873 RepID=A0A4Q9DUT3_9BACL|nr:carbohydrate ABC transporter permease [Paenibacillus thalictri]TBL79463.1 carbohydrate ABC transporter permease [Paenibacillus thalictri]
MSRSSRILLHAFIIAGCLVMIYPLLWMFVSSFKDNTEIFRNTSLIPEAVTFDNYIEGWRGLSGYTFGTFFINTFYLVALCIIGNLISCSMAAYAFARLQFFMRKLFFAVMLTTLMLPFHVTVIPQYIMFNKLGWINSYLPLVLPKFLGVEAFFIFLIVQFIRSLPRELDQAAEIDGCGPIKMYWYLIIPLTVPALMTTSIFTFIWTYNDFFSQLLYISDIKMFPIALALRMFTDSMGRNSWGSLFAMSILSLVPVFAMFIFFQRYLIEGISTGSLKG